MTRPAGLPVLTFHSFGTSRAVTSTDPSWFDDTLALLSGSGFRCLDLTDWVERGSPEEPRGYAITIDDGLRSILKIRESLSRHRATATVFLVTGRVGSSNAWLGQPSRVPTEPLLSWDEIEELTKHGFRFAAHGVSHIRLDLCESSRIEAELRGSRDAIEARLGAKCPLFSYPYGTVTRDIRELSSRHFRAGFGTRLDFADSLQDPFDLARIDAFYLRSPRVREALIAGEARSLLRWRRALRGLKQAAVEPFRRTPSW